MKNVQGRIEEDCDGFEGEKKGRKKGGGLYWKGKREMEREREREGEKC